MFNASQLRSTRVGSVHLYSEKLDAELMGITGVSRMDSVPDAIRESVRRSGDKRVAVIPEGPYVVPTYAPPA